MREHIHQGKKTTSSVSIPSLKQPTRGFGLDSLNASPPAVTEAQPINKPPGHDISRIALHRPQAKISNLSGAEMIQRLRYKSDSAHQININSLSFARVLDYLKRNDPDPDVGGVIFDEGDKAALQKRADELYPRIFQEIYDLLGTSEVVNEKNQRKINASVNLQNILQDMQKRHDSGNLLGFREWLASLQVNLNPPNVLDKINELRAIENIAEPVANVDETPIANTDQTADIEHGTSQTEVKTIRNPIRSYQDFTGQVTAALAKFANVNPTDGKSYNATIYGFIDQKLIDGEKTEKKGVSSFTKIDPTTLMKTTTITHSKGGRTIEENQLEKLLNNLNTQNWAGAKRTHNIYIMLENGAKLHLVRNMVDDKWALA